MVDREKLEGELQKKMMEYRIMESRISSMSNQRELFSTKMLEVQSTLTGMDQITKGHSDMIFPIGSGSYVKGQLSEEKKILVEIGANVALNMGLAEAKEYLESRKKELEEGIEIINKDLENTVLEMKKLELDAQKLIAEAQTDDDKFKVVSG